MRTCRQCGTTNADDAASCSRCGAFLAPSPVMEGESAVKPSSARPTGAAASEFRLDTARWSGADKVAGAATLVLFITLFLPWFGYGGQSVDGLWHGFEYITLIVALAIVAYLIALAAVPSLQLNSAVRHDLLLLTGTAVNLLLVLIGFLAKPSASVFFVTVSADWEFGAFFGLIAALVAVGAAASPLLAERTRR